MSQILVFFFLIYWLKTQENTLEKCYTTIINQVAKFQNYPTNDIQEIMFITIYKASTLRTYSQ